MKGCPETPACEPRLLLQVAFLLLSQEQHGSAREGPELLPSAPVAAASQEDGGLETGGGAYFGFWMESHSGNGCKEQTKRNILSLSHHLDKGH